MVDGTMMMQEVNAAWLGGRELALDLGIRPSSSIRHDANFACADGIDIYVELVVDGDEDNDWPQLASEPPVAHNGAFQEDEPGGPARVESQRLRNLTCSPVLEEECDSQQREKVPVSDSVVHQAEDGDGHIHHSGTSQDFEPVTASVPQGKEGHGNDHQLVRADVFKIETVTCQKTGPDGDPSPHLKSTDLGVRSPAALVVAEEELHTHVHHLQPGDDLQPRHDLQPGDPHVFQSGTPQCTEPVSDPNVEQSLVSVDKQLHDRQTGGVEEIEDLGPSKRPKLVGGPALQECNVGGPSNVGAFEFEIGRRQEGAVGDDVEEIGTSQRRSVELDIVQPGEKSVTSHSQLVSEVTEESGDPRQGESSDGQSHREFFQQESDEQTSDNQPDQGSKTATSPERESDWSQRPWPDWGEPLSQFDRQPRSRDKGGTRVEPEKDSTPSQWPDWGDPLPPEEDDEMAIDSTLEVKSPAVRIPGEKVITVVEATTNLQEEREIGSFSYSGSSDDEMELDSSNQIVSRSNPAGVPSLDQVAVRSNPAGVASSDQIAVRSNPVEVLGPPRSPAASSLISKQPGPEVLGTPRSSAAGDVVDISAACHLLALSEVRDCGASANQVGCEQAGVSDRDLLVGRIEELSELVERIYADFPQLSFPRGTNGMVSREEAGNWAVEVSGDSNKLKLRRTKVSSYDDSDSEEVCGEVLDRPPGKRQCKSLQTLL